MLTRCSRHIMSFQVVVNCCSWLLLKCTNKPLRKVLQTHIIQFHPEEFFFWYSQLVGSNWRGAWLCPFQFCVSNKVREVLNILHNIYPYNKSISKFTDAKDKCSFCENEHETITFVLCLPILDVFWRDKEKCIYKKTEQSITIKPIDDISSPYLTYLTRVRNSVYLMSLIYFALFYLNLHDLFILYIFYILISV